MVPNAGPEKNNTVVATGLLLVIYIVWKRFGAALRRRSDVKNAVWLFAASECVKDFFVDMDQLLSAPIPEI
jgi:hypothetical protein